jgi:hypothetical protein
MAISGDTPPPQVCGCEEVGAIELDTQEIDFWAGRVISKART